MTGEIEPYLVVGAVLFMLGAIGFLTRRNLIIMVLSAELMLHGVALTLVTFSKLHNTVQGQAFTVFTLTVAACEAGLALALILALFRQSQSLDVNLWSGLREPDLPAPQTFEPEVVGKVAGEEFPKLSPAGHVPVIPETVPETTLTHSG